MSVFEFFVYKNATRVDDYPSDYEVALRSFYYFLHKFHSL